MGGPGMQAEKKILRQFDKDSNGYLDAIERNAARESLAKDISSRPGGGPGGMGRPGGRGPGGRGPGPGGGGGRLLLPPRRRPRTAPGPRPW
jgi:hypothetical protein